MMGEWIHSKVYVYLTNVYLTKTINFSASMYGSAPKPVLSPASPLEGAAVLGVIVELRHPLLEQVPHLTALQIRHGQLVLGVDKGLQGEHAADVGIMTDPQGRGLFMLTGVPQRQHIVYSLLTPLTFVVVSQNVI